MSLISLYASKIQNIALLNTNFKRIRCHKTMNVFLKTGFFCQALYKSYAEEIFMANVLVVDDEEGITEIVEHLLTEKGHQVNRQR